MSDPTPYLYLPGTARAALSFYADVFGCAATLHTFAEFGRTDGPAKLFAADIAGDEPAFTSKGLQFALLGTAAPSVLREWFARLSAGGTVIDDLQQRPWGAHDGQVIDRYGLHWLIGFESEG